MEPPVNFIGSLEISSLFYVKISCAIVLHICTSCPTTSDDDAIIGHESDRADFRVNFTRTINKVSEIHVKHQIVGADAW